MKRHRGFTLIELLIVIGIVGILSTLVITRFASPQADAELDLAVSTISADIRTVTSWAQSGKIDSVTGTVPRGYGIVFLKTTSAYDIYAEFDGNNKFDAGIDTLIQHHDIEVEELISNVIIGNCFPGVASCDFFVQLPGGNFYSNATLGADMGVVLSHTQSGDEITMKINGQTGQLEY
ncbi:MAG: type II secretion system protein [Candidatus Kerfeldbacteria bacterium]